MDIKNLRVKLGISQKEFADETGISKAKIGKWETGIGSPKVKDYMILMNYFTKKGIVLEENEEIVDEEWNNIYTVIFQKLNEEYPGNFFNHIEEIAARLGIKDLSLVRGVASQKVKPDQNFINRFCGAFNISEDHLRGITATVNQDNIYTDRDWEIYNKEIQHKKNQKKEAPSHEKQAGHEDFSLRQVSDALKLVLQELYVVQETQVWLAAKTHGLSVGEIFEKVDSIRSDYQATSK